MYFMLETIRIVKKQVNKRINMNSKMEFSGSKSPLKAIKKKTVKTSDKISQILIAAL